MITVFYNTVGLKCVRLSDYIGIMAVDPVQRLLEIQVQERLCHMYSSGNTRLGDHVTVINIVQRSVL